MPAGEEGDQDLADHALLPDDGLRELGFEPRGDLSHPVEIAFAAGLRSCCDVH